MMSQNAHVPEQEALAIGYPGYVQNVEAALDTMGGINAIEKAHFDGGGHYVQVNCRPGDNLAHSLYGEQKRSNALLLRLTKHRGSKDGAASSEQPAVHAEVAARVTSSYRFMSMADFQYADVPSKDVGDYAEVDGPYGPERGPMNILPPLFSKQDEPLDYSFKRPTPSTSAQQARAKAPATQQQQQQPPTSQPAAQPSPAVSAEQEGGPSQQQAQQQAPQQEQGNTPAVP